MRRYLPILFLVITLPLASQELRGPELSSYEVLRQVLESRSVPGLVLLDVRAREEYNQGHIPGSFSVPREFIGDDFDRKSKIALDAYILLIGKPASSDTRKAQFLLEGLGYTNVHIFGSITKWEGKLQ